MRASVFVNLEKVKVRQNGSLPDIRFIVVDVDDLTIFFDGYGREHAENVRAFGLKLIKTADILLSIVANDEAVAMTKAEYDAETARLELEAYSVGDEPHLLHDTREEQRGEK